MGSFFGALVCRTDNVPEGDHYSEEQADQQTPWIGPREIPDGITDDRTTKKPPEKIRKNPVTAAIVRIGPGSLGKVTLFFALLGGTSFVASDIFGLSPLWSGIALGTPAIGYAFGNFLSGRFSVRVGINRMAIIGMVVTILGLGTSAILTLSGVNHPLNFFGFCVFLGLGNGMMLPNVMAGSISVRPHLAGTASGLGGAIMVGGGAALAKFAGGILTVETGTMPLQLFMLGTTIVALLSVLFVVGREKQIA